MKKLLVLLIAFALVLMPCAAMAEYDMHNTFALFTLMEELDELELTDAQEMELMELVMGIDFEQVTDRDIAALQAFIDDVTKDAAVMQPMETEAAERPTFPLDDEASVPSPEADHM